MKKLVLSAALLCLSFSAFAKNDKVYKVEKTIACSSLASVIDELTGKYKEMPIWKGKQDNGNVIALLVNPKTGSWTVIEFNDETACALGVGEVHEFLKKSS